MYSRPSHAASPTGRSQTSWASPSGPRGRTCPTSWRNSDLRAERRPPSWRSSTAWIVPMDPADYDVDGPEDGQPIVFVHGTRLCRTMWRAQMDDLRDRYRVIALD